jgi:hypothetical protein
MNNITENMKYLSNNDLYNNQYSEKELIENIDHLFLLSIIETQKNLSKEFIDEYILNEKYQTENDDDICLDELLKHQSHYGKIKQEIKKEIKEDIMNDDFKEETLIKIKDKSFLE